MLPRQLVVTASPRMRASQSNALRCSKANSSIFTQRTHGLSFPVFPGRRKGVSVHHAGWAAPASGGADRRARGVVVVLAGLPFARTPLPEIWGFVPVSESWL